MPMAGERHALFLDRDGVVNVDIGYLHKPEACQFLPGIFDLVRRSRTAGYDVFIVTNQAGIARGYYSEATYCAFTEWLLKRFADEDAPITRVYHCPHHPTAGVGEYRTTCVCRKPKPGMLLAAQREYGIEMAGSVMIGDSLSDMVAARAAGVRQLYLLNAQAPADGSFVRIASLADVTVRLSV